MAHSVGNEKNEVKQNKRVVGLKSQARAFGHLQYEGILGITAMFFMCGVKISFWLPSSVFTCAFSNFSPSSMNRLIHFMIIIILFLLLCFVQDIFPSFTLFKN